MVASGSTKGNGHKQTWDFEHQEIHLYWRMAEHLAQVAQRVYEVSILEDTQSHLNMVFSKRLQVALPEQGDQTG